MTRWNVARLVVLASAGAVAVVVGLVVSGAAAPSVLGDPGALVRWGLPVVETLGQLAAALTLGSLVLAVAILPRVGARAGTRPARRAGAPAVDGRAYPAALTLAGAAASVWTALSVVGLVLTYASIAGRPVGGPGFSAELGLFVGQVLAGPHAARHHRRRRGDQCGRARRRHADRAPRGPPSSPWSRSCSSR